MKRATSIVLLLLVTALALSACGKATSSQKQEAQQEATKFEALAKKCLPSKDGVPDLSPLRHKGGLKGFATCLVPQSQQHTFTRCAESAVVSNFNKVKIEAGLNACLKKVS